MKKTVTTERLREIEIELYRDEIGLGHKTINFTQQIRSKILGEDLAVNDIYTKLVKCRNVRHYVLDKQDLQTIAKRFVKDEIKLFINHVIETELKEETETVVTMAEKFEECCENTITVKELVERGIKPFDLVYFESNNGQSHLTGWYVAGQDILTGITTELSSASGSAIDIITTLRDKGELNKGRILAIVQNKDSYNWDEETDTLIEAERQDLYNALATEKECNLVYFGEGIHFVKYEDTKAEEMSEIEKEITKLDKELKERMKALGAELTEKQRQLELKLRVLENNRKHK